MFISRHSREAHFQIKPTDWLVVWQLACGVMWDYRYRGEWLLNKWMVEVLKSLFSSYRINSWMKHWTNRATTLDEYVSCSLHRIVVCFHEPLWALAFCFENLHGAIYLGSWFNFDLLVVVQWQQLSLCYWIRFCLYYESISSAALHRIFVSICNQVVWQNDEIEGKELILMKNGDGSVGKKKWRSSKLVIITTICLGCIIFFFLFHKN